MKTFREYLIETIDNTRSHFTSLKNLVSILKDGKLNGRQRGYYRGKKDLKKINNYDIAQQQSDDVIKELCLIRKNLKQNIDILAAQDADFEIVFDWDNIKNLRIIKKPYPFSEWSTNYNYGFIEQLKRLENENVLTQNDLKKLYSLYLKYSKRKNTDEIDKVFNSLSVFDKYPELKDLDIFSENSKKFLYYLDKIKDRNKKEELYNLQRELFNLRDEMKYKSINSLKFSRDGEERIDLSKNSIPVSSKYMKIIVPRVFNKKEKSKVSNEEINKYLEELNHLIKQYIKTDPSLFEFK